MASTRIPEQSSVTITVPASSALATNSSGPYSIDQVLNFPNYPPAQSNVFRGSGANVTSAFTNATVVTISAGIHPVQYNVGVGPAVIERTNYQPAPGTLNATGTLTAALILGGIVTSTSAAAVTATLDTGTVMDAALTMAVDDSFDWALINTGPNTVTVTAATGHTIVGTATVVTVVSARFRTRKTAANTFVTYRMA
jgi:hypothetical protein